MHLAVCCADVGHRCSVLPHCLGTDKPDCLYRGRKNQTEFWNLRVERDVGVGALVYLAVVPVVKTYELRTDSRVVNHSRNRFEHRLRVQVLCSEPRSGYVHRRLDSLYSAEVQRKFNALLYNLAAVCNLRVAVERAKFIVVGHRLVRILVVAVSVVHVAVSETVVHLLVEELYGGISAVSVVGGERQFPLLVACRLKIVVCWVLYEGCYNEFRVLRRIFLVVVHKRVEVAVTLVGIQIVECRHLCCKPEAGIHNQFNIADIFGLKREIYSRIGIKFSCHVELRVQPRRVFRRMPAVSLNVFFFIGNSRFSSA